MHLLLLLVATELVLEAALYVGTVLATLLAAITHFDQLDTIKSLAADESDKSVNDLEALSIWFRIGRQIAFIGSFLLLGLVARLVTRIRAK